MPLERNICIVPSALAAALLLLGAAAVAGRAGERPPAGHHVGRTTFAYGIYDLGVRALGDRGTGGKFFAGFRQGPDGHLTAFPLSINSHDVRANPVALTVTPDGRSLYAECSNTSATEGGLYTPYFLRLILMPDGQLQLGRRFGANPGLGAFHLTFNASRRCAYLLSSPRLGAGSVLEFRLGPQGQFLSPPATAPCGVEPQGLALGKSGRVLYALDFQGGRLWQYALTAQGRPVSLQPPSVPVGRMRVGPAVTPGGVCAADDRALYHFRTGPNGTLTPLPSFPLAAGDVPLAIAPLGGGALAVQLMQRLLVLRAGPGGALVRVATLPVQGNSVCRVDPSGRFLYVQGLHTRIYVFRIRVGGRLIPVHAPPVRTGTELTDLVFVRR